MSQELHYTSVPRGLKPGARGFCTVAHTAGLSQTLIERLEGISGYQPRFKPRDPDEAHNPVNWSHLRLTGTGSAVSVLSRVGPAPLDYTGRENKHAHHVVLDPGERPAGGPAWLLARPGLMQSSWPKEPQLVAARDDVPVGDSPPTVCGRWAAQTGDAGWAGVVAESFLADPKRVVILVYEPGPNLELVLSLFAESIALLPPDRRWEVTFSTYLVGLPPGLSCCWRGVLRDSPEERQARANPESLIIDLWRPLGPARGGPLVTQARDGKPAFVPSPASRRPRLTETPAHEPALDGASTPPPPVAPTPAAGSPMSADPYSLAKPPPAPRPRTRRPVEAKSTSTRGGASAWPIVASVAALLVVVLAVGGAGLAIYLRTAKVEVAHAGDIRTQAGRPDTTNPGQTPTQSVGPVNEVTGAGPPTPNVDTGGQGGMSDSTPEPSPDDGIGGGKPLATANGKDTPPSMANPNEGGGSNEVTSAPTKKPEEKGPPTLGFFKITPAGDDPLLVPTISAPRPVARLKLIGGDDEEVLAPYRFELADDEGKDTDTDTDKNKDRSYKVTETKLTEKPVGTFTVDRQKIAFDWEASDEGSNQKVRDRLSDCVLEAELDDGTRSYYLLRQPKMTSLPRPLVKEIPDRFPPEDKESWKFGITWCGDQDAPWARRTPNLRELTVILPDGKPLDFKSEDAKKKQYVAELQPSPATLHVDLPATSPGKLQFTLSPRPRSKEETKKHASHMKNSEADLDKRKYLFANQTEMAAAQGVQIDPQMQQEWQKELQQRQATLLKEKGLATLEKTWRDNLKSLLAADIEALVTLKAGGREFALPRLRSGGKGGNRDKGGEE